MRLLIVEDDAILAFRMDEVLTKAGHTIIGFGFDAETSLQSAAVTRPGLALIDLALAKNASGAMVARELDERHAVPSIFVSGSPDECRKVAREAGVLGCLSKPFTDQELTAAVAAVENVMNGHGPGPVPLNFEFYSLVI